MVGPLPPTVGGITSLIKSILESDLNKKYRFITFATERPTSGIVKDVNDYTLIFHIGLTCLAKSAASTMHHLLNFPFTLIFKHPNLVHINTPSYWAFWENSIYILISKLFRKKTLVHIHGGLFDKFYRDSNRFSKFLIRKFLDLPDNVIVLSSKWKEFFKNLVPENKIIILKNFVNLSRFNQPEREVDPKDVVKVLFIGGAEAKTKGVYDLLKAIPKVINKYPNVLFRFVACRNMAKLKIYEKEQIKYHTRFFGYIQGNEKVNIFKTSDIFVLPSYAEGLPVAMLEAMAAGLPIIATPVGAIPEIIEDGKNGFLIKIGDYDALVDRILQLAQNKELRQEMGKNNIEKIRKQYDVKVITKKLDNVYDALLKIEKS